MIEVPSNFVRTLTGSRSALQSPPDGDPSVKRCQPCVDLVACCPPSELICSAADIYPPICRCCAVWSCQGETCEQEIPPPSLDGAWHCAWSPQVYTCSHDQGLPHVIGDRWGCALTGNAVSCTSSFPPNPCNSAAGVAEWSCSIEDKLLRCSRR